MKSYKDDSWLTNNNWGKWGDDDEIGVLNEVTSENILAAASLIKKGKVYDLETLRFKGMPVWEGHCGFDIVTYASPKGRRNMKNSDYSSAYSWYAPGGFLDPAMNKYHSGGNTEMII